MAAAMEFDELRQGQLAIVVTEAAGNIAAHAGKGEIILSPWSYGSLSGIDVFALDQGGGIKDIALSLEDGHSTGGTPGNGLGAMSRLAGTFQIYSSPGAGTAVFVRVLRTAGMVEAESNSYMMSTISLPINGETVCGDSWSAIHISGRSTYIVVDGLGHGPAAAEAANEAIRVFHQAIGKTPEERMSEIHGALAKTRGAAVSIAEILPEKGILNYIGVGNVVASICSGGKCRSLVSMNGIVGNVMGRLQQFTYPWEVNSTLLMLSDGLGTRWNMEQYPGLTARHPALIAGVLYRDFCRRRDDATILVSRI
jgi:anti-sigma regulatory factor (Ser/Thr protein kinase)